MSVFTKEDDWFEGALRVEMPTRPRPLVAQWAEDDPTEEPDEAEEGVELPLDDGQEEDPFGDFDDEDFDDDFDDDFEEELEDDYEIEPDDSEMFPDDDDEDSEFEEEIADDDA